MVGRVCRPRVGQYRCCDRILGFHLWCCRSFWGQPDLGKNKRSTPILFRQAFQIRDPPKFQARRYLTIHLAHSWVVWDWHYEPGQSGGSNNWTATMAQFDHQRHVEATNRHFTPQNPKAIFYKQSLPILWSSET